MASHRRRDLSFAFQPLIHEPLSNPEFLQNAVNGDVVVNGDTSNGTPEHTHEQQVLFAAMREAFASKVQHPRKAMSLFLKAGKGLVLTGDDETALECFESLIHLAKEQLNHVCAEKSKLPPLTPEERTEIYRMDSIRQQESIREEAEPNKTQAQKLLQRQVSIREEDEPCENNAHNSIRSQDSIRDETEAKDNGHNCQDEPELDKTVVVNGYSDSTSSVCHGNDNITIISVDYDPALNTETNTVMQEQTIISVEERATEVVQACDESNMFVVQEESNDFCCVETVVEDHSTPSSRSSMSDDVGNPVAFTEAVVHDFAEGSVACAAELAQEDMQICELVECTESSPEVFQVSAIQCDDIVSLCSLGSSENIARINEIVMECNEQLVEEVPMNPVEKALIRRGYVVSELLDTEQSYVQDLGHVVKGYIQQFSSGNDLPVELKNKEKEVFSNLEDIYEWHSRNFSFELKFYEDEPDRIGEIFVQSEQRMEELYSEYCRNKLKSDSLVQKYTDTYFQGCKERLGHRLQLADYLIKPVQRITKYQLLLKDILKHQERAGEGCTNLEKALEVALRILKRTNDMVNVGMLQGYEVNPEDTGDLVLQNELLVVDGKSKTKGKERRVFLFEKILIFSEPMTREGGLPAYRYVHHMKTKGIGQTESVDIDPCKWAVWIRKLGGAEIFLLKASSPETKATWIQSIKECHDKKRPGLLKGWYKNRGRSAELKDADSTDAGLLRIRSQRQGGSRRTTVKRKTSKESKGAIRGRDMSASERLRENIRRFRTEEKLIAVDPTSFRDDSEQCEGLIDGTSQNYPSVPESPSTEADAQLKVAEMSLGERWLKWEAEENQLHKLLHVTRMIAARLLQLRDRERALEIYNDVIAATLSLEELRKLEGLFAARDVLLSRSLEIYEGYRKEQANVSFDVEDNYNSLTSLLNETAGYSSVSRGNTWSIVLYSITAVAASREQHWREASQAFYRVSMVYSNMQATMCAVDSLLDAHWMCCQAEDYLTALQFLYNGFIRALAAKDLMRCLRLEQQALHLVDKVKSLGPKLLESATEEGELDARQQVSTHHVEFLLNMSRATRRRDWAWFEIAETELQKLCSGDGHQADAVLQTVFLKIKKSLPGPSEC